MVHIQADPDDRDMPYVSLSAHFNQHTRNFFFGDDHVVRQFHRRLKRELFRNRIGDRARRPFSQLRRRADVDFRPKQNRKPKPFTGGGFPGIIPLAAAGDLAFGKYDQTFRRSWRGAFQNGIVRRRCFVEDNNVAANDRRIEIGAELVSTQHVK